VGACLLVLYAGFMLYVRARSDLEAATGLSKLIAVYDCFKNQLNSHFHLSTGDRRMP
jgi:hypothetical protein